MSSHEYHGRTHPIYEVRGPEPILYDGCERCAEQAAEPHLLLDHDHVVALWAKMLDVERGDGRYRSDAEARACRWFYDFAIFLERHTSMDGWQIGILMVAV